MGTALKPHDGAPAPLFDRLVDLEPMQKSEPFHQRVLDYDGLVGSIRLELSRLLDTRAPQSIEEWAKAEKTVLNYGVPDVTHLSCQDGSDVTLVKRLILAAIEAFEPRLANVRLTSEKPGPGSRNFSFNLEGEMVIGSMIEPVSFPLKV